ncbi:HAD hydrolase family protein [Methylophilaceae bacterium]|nr:HAD hydrolase family protein [Methylophilaceae bacterium]
MNYKLNISINDIDAIVLDFDGVLTNNMVHLDQDGREWVSCSRADGLAFDVLRKLKKLSYIISTEKNPVVSERGKKLKIPVFQGVENKVNSLIALAKENCLDIDRILYVGNDLNDYQAMQMCGYSLCPADSHSKIKKISSTTLKTKGGNGVVREIVEEILKLDIIAILYKK